MKISKNTIIVVSIAVVLIAAVLAWYFAPLSAREGASESNATLQKETATLQLKDEPAAKDSKFAALEGEAFDRAFIADMLAHHEGAGYMAEQAQAAAGHQEIREFASDINRAQSQEIIKMLQWQKDWGYEATMGGGHMSHDGEGSEMGGDMVEMMNKLKGLTGEAHDKEFLVQMIVHHEQAVAMSRYAESNAKHEEIKQLAREIIASQGAEVEQMESWQVAWGYKS